MKKFYIKIFLTMIIFTLVFSCFSLNIMADENPEVVSKSSKYNAEIPTWAISEKITYTYDFSNTDVYDFRKDEGIHFTSLYSFNLENGKINGIKSKNMVLYSNNYLGDNYGISGGNLSFKLCVTSGEVDLTLRNPSKTLADDVLCLRLVFKDGNLTIIDDSTEKESEIIASSLFINGKEEKIEIVDEITKIIIKINDEEVAWVSYLESNESFSVSNYECKIIVTDKNGNTLLESADSMVQRAGKFIIKSKKSAFTLDDLSYDFTEIDTELENSDTKRVVDYSNWVATDDLERTVALNDTAGDVETDKQVGVFYFLCWTGAGIHIQDHTKYYLENGSAALNKYLTEYGGEAYWAEPYFGYYKNDDAWVYRKHAYQLEAAGVDFIFLDVSNANTFDDAHTLLFDTWLKIRQEGGDTPQICFLTGDTGSTFDTDIAHLKKTVYSDENWSKYEELFYMWNGKPLIFGNYNDANAKTKEFLGKFEVRGCWAWCDKDGYWNWLTELEQDENGNLTMKTGRNAEGIVEELAISFGHHASTSKGRSYVLGNQPTDGLMDFEFQLESTKYGLGFESQSEYALSVNPDVVMITGWNEWIAGNCQGSSYMANTPVNNVCYVDEFNPEFSRDGEPMKIRDGVGFGDNYYYQMVDFIRKYKGIDKIERATGDKTIDITAGEDVWSDVGPTFTDTIGDVEYRSQQSYDAQFVYLNGTGRNDFKDAKVSEDKDYVYFMITTVNDIFVADDSTFMNIYLDIDMDHETGWEGYDYVINRSRDGEKCSVEKFDGTSWSSTKVSDALYVISGNLMTVKVSKNDIGLKSGKNSNFDFKLADNSTEIGEVMEFMDLGDVAPNDRFNFRYISNEKEYKEIEKQNQDENKKKSGCTSTLLSTSGLIILLGSCLILRKKN